MHLFKLVHVIWGQLVSVLAQDVSQITSLSDRKLVSIMTVEVIVTMVMMNIVMLEMIMSMMMIVTDDMF